VHGQRAITDVVSRGAIVNLRDLRDDDVMPPLGHHYIIHWPPGDVVIYILKIALTYVHIQNSIERVQAYITVPNICTVSYFISARQ
jgi:hypothetical protein